MLLDLVGPALASHRINPLLHSVFGEYFGTVIYDGTWVGAGSAIENIDGIRKDVVDGFLEAGVAGIRWPGGACADHYHWKEGIGPQRPARLPPRPHKASQPNWRHDFWGGANYTKSLRSQLNAQGFAATRLVLLDDAPSIRAPGSCR